MSRAAPSVLSATEEDKCHCRMGTGQGETAKPSNVLEPGTLIMLTAATRAESTWKISAARQH
eukprot:CAMPEP_0195084942 /NCGR_PEP_ID=MMETSP0448-20130528/25495_1 /TAXON_ID=66468 /ORGANISM="Heterocapsa triquestra, Strain CCMP 448" /LENGTH=61 /DNA_ID=CAMNT_0040118309 /DNA_START=151 /DNA_END=336 /DNA_ORIENTATION=+